MELHRSALVEYSAEDMFDLIERAEHYPAFLPWCAAAKILERNDSIVAADITVAWHGLRFQMTTRNPKRRPEWLAVRLERGPFRSFDGEWHIRSLAPHGCKVEFSLRYELDNALARTLAGRVLDRIAQTFVDAFVTRAHSVFGSAPTSDGSVALPGAEGPSRSSSAAREREA